MFCFARGPWCAISLTYSAPTVPGHHVGEPEGRIRKHRRRWQLETNEAKTFRCPKKFLDCKNARDRHDKTYQRKKKRTYSGEKEQQKKKKQKIVIVRAVGRSRVTDKQLAEKDKKRFEKTIKS